MLAPASSDQVTLLNLTAADKKLGELPEYKALLQNFITQEVSSLPRITLLSCSQQVVPTSGHTVTSPGTWTLPPPKPPTTTALASTSIP